MLNEETRIGEEKRSSNGGSADTLQAVIMHTGGQQQKLANNSTVAIIGGGPAGAFSAIHLLALARSEGRSLRVVVFERRRSNPERGTDVHFGQYRGCPQCAGGISPRLNDALADLGIRVPAEVLQCRIGSITVQGNWKHIHLPVPAQREMLSVYRGALPAGHGHHHRSFDSLLLDAASDRGAELIGARIRRVFYDHRSRPVVCYDMNDQACELTADFLVFAGGVNERKDRKADHPTPAQLLQMLQPAYRLPGLRKALIFELEAPHQLYQAGYGELHFIESSVNQLRLDMCSIMPKSGFFTVTLIGGSVDDCTNHKQNLRLVHDFLAIPQIRRTLPPETPLRVRCICNPKIVVGLAAMPWGCRTAAVGDMATSRQYKDGILSAHDMARDLARIILCRGVDTASLEQHYGRTLARFQGDNRYATVIFFLYRWFFTNPFLSRIIYQTYASERKTRHQPRRSFQKIFWDISSGDESYKQIAWAMLRPGTLWKILTGGAFVATRSWFAERFFGLDWSGIGRFPTALSLEQLECKRAELLNSRKSEFECIYTIRVRAEPQVVLGLLAAFGEPDRPYLNPRWVSIARTRGVPLLPGCVIQYRVFAGLIAFSIKQQSTGNKNLLRYRVRNGFAHGGSFLFQIEPESPGGCRLTVYLAFDYARGSNFASRIFWRTFRLLFPEYIHDVLWNHALCQLKQLAETVDLEREPELLDIAEL